MSPLLRISGISLVNGIAICCSDDMYAPESVDLLQKSGIDLQRHEEMGIEPCDFAELMITSGLVLMEDVKWISFHRCVPFMPITCTSPLDMCTVMLREHPHCSSSVWERDDQSSSKLCVMLRKFSSLHSPLYEASMSISTY